MEFLVPDLRSRDADTFEDASELCTDLSLGASCSTPPLRGGGGSDMGCFRGISGAPQ